MVMRIMNRIFGQDTALNKWLVVVLVFLALCARYAPASAMGLPDDVVQPTSTPLPPELLENMYQTNGLLLGGVVLVLIVIAGTLGTIRRSRRR
jgi:hypothetical protein